ncbi:MAG: hypothetical protein HY316_00560 [Acidobacteria bacterium]|nr:hypothetical protein [Acidobacteriota bacterium]
MAPGMEQDMPPGHEGMQMGSTGMAMNDGGMFLMNQASGTGTNPASSQTPMLMQMAGTWNLMFHTSIFLNELQQTGPRGGDKFFSTNWFMGMAERRIGKGSFMARAMLSLDPLTVTKRRYPELFQTGETAFGKPIIDAQHPHDFLMEFSLQYARPISEHTMVNFYFAPVGDPAMGPVAFPHRISAAELPQATLGHHVQDSTHIANEVITAGVSHGGFRLEASGFHGAEPNENRWNIDHGAVDSWSTRLALSPCANWSGQVSLGRLAKPEALEAGDIVRSTASLTYNKPLPGGFWATSLMWGRNHKTDPKQNINSYLAESLVQISQQNYVTGRLELVDKDELFAHNGDGELTEPTAVFRIGAYTLGYARAVKLFLGIQSAIGGNFTVYTLPGTLKPSYGEHPTSFLLYFRIHP